MNILFLFEFFFPHSQCRNFPSFSCAVELTVHSLSLLERPHMKFQHHFDYLLPSCTKLQNIKGTLWRGFVYGELYAFFARALSRSICFK